MNTKVITPQYTIRGVTLYGFRDMAQCLDFLYDRHSVRYGTLTAINAEKILAAEKDIKIKKLLQSADVRYADGISIVRAVRKKYPGSKIARIAGADLWQALMARAGREGVPVFLIGGRPDVLAATAVKLHRDYNVKIVGTQDGFSLPKPAHLFQQVAASGARIVTVALGSPAQEKWISDCRRVYPDALFMGVGGTYDVFTGQVKRAPLLWQTLGLEWLYRLLLQPKRLPRQLRLLKFVRYYLRGEL